MSLPLFVYGTLLYTGVRQQVIGRDLRTIPARLVGFRRVRITGRDYPGLRKASGHEVRGLLLEGLQPTEMKQLDRYEGAEYVRSEQVTDTASGQRRAWVYLPRTGVRLGDDDWSPDSLRRKFHRAFSRKGNSE